MNLVNSYIISAFKTTKNKYPINKKAKKNDIIMIYKYGIYYVILPSG